MCGTQLTGPRQESTQLYVKKLGKSKKKRARFRSTMKVGRLSCPRESYKVNLPNVSHSMPP